MPSDSTLIGAGKVRNDGICVAGFYCRAQSSSWDGSCHRCALPISSILTEERYPCSGTRYCRDLARCQCRQLTGADCYTIRPVALDRPLQCMRPGEVPRSQGVRCVGSARGCESN